MSDNLDRSESESKRGRYKHVWLVLLPLVVLLAVAAYWGAKEWKVARANQRQFEDWEEAGIPFDSTSQQKFYNDHTYPQGTADWIKIEQLTEWGHQAEDFKRLPYLGYEGKEPKVLIPGGETSDWPEAPLVASFLKEMEPVIDLIERASSHPTPVRFPVNFQGSKTLLTHVQNARSMARLLSLDCDYAYFSQDTERTLRDLSLMAATTEAYDGRECLVSGLVNIALRGIRMGALRRTLTHCEWSAAELKTLRSSLMPKEDIATRWQELMVSERAFGLSMINESREELAQSVGQQARFKLFTAPTEVKTLIEVYQRIIELPIESDVSSWRRRASALEDWVYTLPANSLAGMLAPASGQCLEAEVRSEETRRWTLTAVAIRQFKQKNGKWPERLAELESVGLKLADYTDTEKNVFGYEVEGDKAFLWKRHPNQSWGNNLADRQISKIRPGTDQDIDGFGATEMQISEEEDMSDFLLELN